MDLDCLENTIKDYGINMPQVLSATDNSLDDLFRSWNLKQQKTPLTFKDDPVTLTCAAYRMYQENVRHRWLDFDQVVVWHDDREQAACLKKYYRDRLVIEALKSNGAEVSQFRQKLRKLVTDELVITESELGMLYRLPYFYEEDQALDRVIAKTDNVQPGSYCKGTEVTATYTLAERVLRSRRVGEEYDYWMTTDQDPYLHLIEIRHDNPLRNMFESVIAKPVKLKTLEWTKDHYGYHRGRLYQKAVVQGFANE